MGFTSFLGLFFTDKKLNQYEIDFLNKQGMQQKDILNEEYDSFGDTIPNEIRYRLYHNTHRKGLKQPYVSMINDVSKNGYNELTLEVNYFNHSFVPIDIELLRLEVKFGNKNFTYCKPIKVKMKYTVCRCGENGSRGFEFILNKTDLKKVIIEYIKKVNEADPHYCVEGSTPNLMCRLYVEEGINDPITIFTNFDIDASLVQFHKYFDWYSLKARARREKKKLKTTINNRGIRTDENL